jgi:hypothetical protein
MARGTRLCTGLIRSDQSRLVTSGTISKLALRFMIMSKLSLSLRLAL